MRLTSIHIENFQGARAVAIDLQTPVVLIAGANHAGKSSIAEAVRLAMLGSPERVGLKKEYGALVTDGAKLGSITLGLEDTAVSIALPKGTQTGEAAIPQSAALPYVLAPDRFASADADKRRTLLFALSGQRVKPEEIERRLLARNCPAALVTQIKPILRTGFAAGAEYAKQQATQAKGAWKTATGEQWGSQKAEGWTAEAPPFDEAALDAARADFQDASTKVEDAVKALGSLEQQASSAAAAHDQLAARKTKADSLPALRAKLAFDEGEHAKLTKHVEALEAKAGNGPREGLVHELADWLFCTLNFIESNGAGFEPNDAAQASLDRYTKQYGPIGSKGDADASAALPKAIEARDLMARSVDNDRRDIAAAEAAAQELQGSTAPEKVDQITLEQARKVLKDLRMERQAADESAQKLLNVKLAATSAEERTANAARYHQEVLTWSALGDALSPDGIPGEVLAEALQPINDKLAELADVAGWRPVAIAADMTITFGGRAYRLLSESERWRVDALLGTALAELSGLRFLILDRFDCLDLLGRQDALILLDAMAVDQRLDSVLLLGTLKSAPAAPTEAFTTYWVNDGVVDRPHLLAAA